MKQKITLDYSLIKELEFDFLESEKNLAIHYLGLSYNIPTSTEKSSQVKKDSNIIYSPMPGLITNIMVKEGQEVEVDLS